MSIDLHTEEMTINMGPHHPATHGVFRMILKLDGEIIKDCIPIIGYLHRSLEKMGETMIYPQYIPVLDRFDYLGNLFGEYVFVSAVEKIGNIEVPERAEYLRVITMELNRIASHLFWLGSFLLDMGATSIIIYAVREREIIVDLLEELTGQRMMYNYFRFGGVRYDIPDSGWLKRVKEFTTVQRKRIVEYEKIITNNPIFLQRVKNIGIISAKDAINYGAMGPILRGSGVPWDLRKDDPYSVYNKFDFKIPTGKVGDTFDRYMVRIQEMYQSCNIIDQAVDNIPSGEITSKKKIPVTFKIPAGEVYTHVEAPRGNMGCYLISDGTSKPARVKLRGASFVNLEILPLVLQGVNVSDIMPIFASFDIVLPEVDR